MENIMKHFFKLRNATCSILVAGLICGIPSVVFAQIGGPGQVGGLGEGGAPAGEYVGERPLPNSGRSMSGQKGSQNEASRMRGSNSTEQGAAIGSSPIPPVQSQVQPSPIGAQKPR